MNTNIGRGEFIATTAQTDFDFNFKIFNVSDIKVYQRATGEQPNDTTDEITAYTTVIDGDNGGTVTLNTGATNLDIVTVVRDLPIERNYDYIRGRDLTEASLDADQDYQTYLTLDRESALNLRFQDSSQGMDNKMPTPASELYLRWNSTGTALENDNTAPQYLSDTETARDTAVASAVSANSSATSATASEVSATASATSAELDKWIAEAEKLTADSRANEAEDVVTKTFTSNGDGTFTIVDDTTYSALHYNAKAEAIVLGEIPLAVGNINNPLLDIPLKNNLTLKQGVGTVTFTRSTTATYLDRYGIIQASAIDTPRFEKEGLLIEGASTNKILHSEDFTNAVWTTLGTITSRTVNFGTSPRGDTTSTRIVFGATNSAVRQVVTSVVGSDETGSLWVKGTAAETIQLSVGDGVDIVNYLHTLSGDWERIEETVTAPTLTTSYLSINTYGGATALDIEVWGGQSEELPLASSYIPTTTASVTRDADKATIEYVDNIPDKLNSLTVIVDNSILGVNSENQTLMYVNANAYLRMVRSSDGGLNFLASGNSTDRAKELSVPATKIRSCGVFDTVSNILYRDGVNVAEDLSSIPITGSNVNIQLGRETTTKYLFGHISSFRIYDRALTDREVALA